MAGKALKPWNLKSPHISRLVSLHSVSLDPFPIQHDSGERMSRRRVGTESHSLIPKSACQSTLQRFDVRPFAFTSRSSTVAAMPSCITRSSHFSTKQHCGMTMTTTTQCRSCGETKFNKCFLVCPSCNAVQSPDPAITYFQIFDQDPKYELDLKDLEAKYKSLMKKLHPDLSHGKSMEEKENSVQLSALVTTAYDELLNPVSRATYLLKLQGIHVEEEGTVNDSELIMEVMEIRETLESTPDKKTLERLHDTARARMDQWSNTFNTALKEGNNASAIGALQRMSYFGRVCDDIKRELL